MTDTKPPVTVRKSSETTFDGRPKLAVWAGERLLGYVWKNYSVGTRVTSGWRFEATREAAGNRFTLDRADRERAYRLASPGSRSVPGRLRRDAVDDLVRNVETLDRLYGR